MTAATSNTIDYRLVDDALPKVGTLEFEKFCQAFYSSLQNRDFVPLGGVHDGGADGYVDIFEDETKTHFIQITKQDGTSTKIRATVKRHRAYGRDPKYLTLLTSQVQKDSDKLGSDLTKELSVKISIRDANYIRSNINASKETRQAFYSYLDPFINYLYRPGAIQEAPAQIDGIDRTLAVFLRQEVLARRGQKNMTQSITDSLIIWALRDTDPDKKDFLTSDQILQRILNILPSAKSFVNATLQGRLKALSIKENGLDRQIRVYNKDPKIYCLPFETRKHLASQNADDELLKLQVSAKIEERSMAADLGIAENWGLAIADLCHAVIEKCFYEQGLNILQFIEGSGANEADPVLNISREIAYVVEGAGYLGDESIILRGHIAKVLRGVFYNSTEAERVYLSRLSCTYALLLLVRNEPKIVEYFSSMSANFDLYIGTDMIVRALSEQHIAPTDRYTENLFALLKASGSNLILTVKSVEEVGSHLRRQIFEFENHYEEAERFVHVEDIKNIDRLLIRSYFYSRLSPVEGQYKPRSFRDFINQFVSYNDVRAQRGWDDLAAYLCSKFGFTYEDESEMMKFVDADEVEELTESIHLLRNSESMQEKDRVLAYNDALQVLRVYGRRIEKKETNPTSPFGFRTWWLTQDRKVRIASQKVMKKRGDVRFMMRPEFLLHYIGLNPKLEEVRASFDTIMPSVLGIHLGGHIDSAVYKQLLRDANEIAQTSEARAFAMVRADAQKLQSDFGREYAEIDDDL